MTFSFYLVTHLIIFAHPPTIFFAHRPDIQISGSQFVEKGNTLTLTCNATGFDYPPDELDWFKDGLKLTSDLRRTLRKDVSSFPSCILQANISR